jgi:ribA/ribD-fused uncharacterized protein
MRITDTHIYFFRNKDIYSNFYYSKFYINDINFTCAEQALMYKKAILFKDFDTARLILANKIPYEIKQLGRKVKNFKNDIWLEHRDNILYEVLYNKFSQDKYLYDQLLSTHEQILVEASPYDKIYGVGLSEDDDKILDENNWKGENLLGNTLMKVRNLLKNIK